MKILLSIFFGLILIILASHLKINVIYLTKQKKSLKIQFNINLGLYLFGFIKILGIALKEDRIHFLFFTFPYNKIKIDKESMKFFKKFSVLDMLRSLNIKLEKLYFDLKIGSEDMMLTVFLVAAISSFLSIICAKNRKQINLKNYHYWVTPIYNKNQLSMKVSSIISIPLLNILGSIYFARKTAKRKKQYKFNFKNIPIKI